MTCSLGSVSKCGPFRFMEDFVPLRASNTCAWATLLTRLPDLDNGAPAAWHTAAHPELVLVGVHRDDLEVPHRGGLVTHLAWHALALEDAGRVRRGSDGAGLPDVVGAVGDRSAAEVVALDGPLEAPALAGSAHVDLVSDLEHLHADRPADVARDAAQLLEVPAWGSLQLGEGAGVRLAYPARPDGFEADLHGVVAVVVGGADRRAQVRLDFHDGPAHEPPVVLEGLGHVLFASENCRCHNSLGRLYLDVHSRRKVEADRKSVV